MNEKDKKLASLLYDAYIPTMYKTKFEICSDRVDSAAQAVKDALGREGTLDRITPGSTVAITAGSRGIANIVEITRTVVEEVRRVGAEPYIVPAMGSHGGAVAEVQTQILAHYGITEESVGAPIKSSMVTKKVGVTPDTGLDVHVDAYALEADYIIPVGRVKPHTDFKGKYESGLMKMMAIGLGKQYGADICHKLGMPRMPESVYAFGSTIIKNCSVPFGIALIENAFHQTYSITAVPSELIADEEPQLLGVAKGLVPAVPFDQIDVLIVEEIGKEYSGTGMDTNVTGRAPLMPRQKPMAERIGVFDLTESSFGNFNGIGMADATTRRFFDKCDMYATYPNNITASQTITGMIPPVMPSDECCVKLCLKTVTRLCGDKGERMVWIKNTVSLQEFYASEALLEDIEKDERLCVIGPPCKAAFDDDGNFIDFVPIEG